MQSNLQISQGPHGTTPKKPFLTHVNETVPKLFISS